MFSLKINEQYILLCFIININAIYCKPEEYICIYCARDSELTPCYNIIKEKHCHFHKPIFNFYFLMDMAQFS